jgi:hypothetical protein
LSLAHSRGPFLGHCEEGFSMLLSCKIENSIHIGESPTHSSEIVFL